MLVTVKTTTITHRNTERKFSCNCTSPHAGQTSCKHTHRHTRTSCNITEFTAMSSWKLAEELSMSLYRRMTAGVISVYTEATTCIFTAVTIVVDLMPVIIAPPCSIPAIHWTSPPM